MLKYICFKKLLTKSVYYNNILRVLGEDIMKKDKKFLNDLDLALGNIKDKYKTEILAKYEKKIAEEKASGKKITSILKEIGKPSDVAKSEMEALGKNAKPSIIKVLKEKINNHKEKKEKAKKEKKKKEKKNKKNTFSLFKKTDKVKKEKVKKEKIKKEKVKKEKVKKEKAKKEKDPNKKSFKEKITGFFALITKDIKFKKKSKKEKIVEEIKEAPEEFVEEIKEEFEEEVSEVSEIVPEKHIFESKKDRTKRIIVKTLGVIITTILLFIWLWVTVVFIASLIAYLDGVKFIGINIALFGLDILVLWIVIMVNRLIFKKKMSVMLNIIVTVLSLLIIAIGIVLGLNQVRKIETVKDVSVKYSMTTKLSNYNLSSDTNQKFTITFNSNYKTQYTINYDETLKDKMKLEVKYYECYYDYYVKQTSKGVYVSLKLDNRDRLSVYIDDLKEGLVFDNDELSRYTVKITVNPKDASRVVVQD